jgi:hypothetical protein
VGTIVNDDFVLLSISPDDDCLREIDPVDGSTQASIRIALAGQAVLGGNGLAWDRAPLAPSGAIWALLKTAQVPGRQLVTLNPATGVATIVGDTGSSFAALAFDDAGILYGVTGNARTDPHSLFMLSTTDATPTLVCPLVGSNGEALAFNPVDGLLYRASGGIVEVGSPLIFEALVPNPMGNPCPITPIIPDPILDDRTDAVTEVSALTHYPLVWPGEFLWVQVDGDMFGVTNGGAATFIGQLDHRSKGLAFNAFSVVDDLCAFSLAISDESILEGNTGATNAVFTVTLLTPSNQTVTVDFATADGTATIADNDYVAIPAGRLTFAPGETFKTITVQVNGDLTNETDETFVVNLSNAVNATIASGQGTGTIRNDDP